MSNNNNISFNGKNKYEWEQSYDDLIIYININKYINKNNININIKPKFLIININNIIYQGELYSTIDVSESFWLLQDNICEIHLSKSNPGKVWEFIFKGDEIISQLQYNDEKKKLLLERFQNEHPNFDFTGADINGTIPEPRTFMKDL